ncbi:hypothetical protein SAMN04488502_10949 [Dendrosporobacter quercicolus]|uniref:Radical SAM core domain-containing protein n=2 Tax=Dendrosporobacter quercicolus TaxID=146817 RepID=A0A1G9XBU3_9FIRM|nr:hypothetical protein SAMN04488502_10949 [Dendrosporobacter quercicolus]
MPMTQLQELAGIVLSTTESVCPECLRRISARRVAVGDHIYLQKNCPEHGDFTVLIWQGKPAYQTWNYARTPSPPAVCATAPAKGCPFDCGLCPDHRQQSCCVLLEVTPNCNLHCPVCFAAAAQERRAEPELAVIEGWYRLLLNSGGPYNIQLSGGEPTVRDDLPEIIALGKTLGFSFIQLNTNGLRLAADREYVRQLGKAGLDCVFLQFDGLDDGIYTRLRGRPLLEQKKTVLDHCSACGIGVVLVPTLVPGINDGDIGAILKFAVSKMPVVRGVHFQPVSYFGRYPEYPRDKDRLTLPAVIRNIEWQTGGLMKAKHFVPPGGEHAHCSFHGNFILMPDGCLQPLQTDKEAGCCGQPRAAANGAKRARKFVAKQWSAAKAAAPVIKPELPERPAGHFSSLDEFLERVSIYKLAVSGMAFQDAWTLDLERLRECFIHVVSQDGRIIPFCAYNLTDCHGRPLYRSGE